MADIQVGFKYPVLVDGVDPAGAAVFSDTAGLVSVGVDTDGVTKLSITGSGDDTLTAQEGSRTGSIDLHIADSPLVITLGAPEPA